MAPTREKITRSPPREPLPNCRAATNATMPLATMRAAKITCPDRDWTWQTVSDRIEV